MDNKLSEILVAANSDTSNDYYLCKSKVEHSFNGNVNAALIEGALIFSKF